MDFDLLVHQFAPGDAQSAEQDVAHELLAALLDVIDEVHVIWLRGGLHLIGKFRRREAMSEISGQNGVAVLGYIHQAVGLPWNGA
jgi:hypothetical protein